MRKLLPNFAKMTAKQQKLEGDFRFNHSRLLMHAEEIAFYRGWGIEKNLVRSLFNFRPSLRTERIFRSTRASMHFISIVTACSSSKPS